ncbi:cyclin-I-like [Lineus longissimus]|uniref:cyclin-I-like n=1 Tax=Lineus longissimus TaxID=88925 RepID=UPI002B4D99FE
MKLHSNVDFERLGKRLQDTLLREKETWRPRVIMRPHDSETEICPQQRDNAVRWLMQLTDKWNYHPETFCLSVSILDRFLSLVKSHSKYLRCIAATCFYLAAKVQEEDEVVPGTLEYVVESHCGCTASELLRMERIILNKLQWDLRDVTPLDFLHIFHATLLSNKPHLLDNFSNLTPAHQLSALTAKLKLCLLHHQLMVYRPAILALSLLSLELEYYTQEWLPNTIMLQRMAMVDCHHIVHCREVISNCLSQFRYKNVVFMYSPEAMTKRAKRKVSESNDCEFFDGIKRLYNDDLVDGGGGGGEDHPGVKAGPLGSCANQARREQGLPSLQAVEAT